MVMLRETFWPEHFVRTFVTYLVAAALTLHMLLGCCRHHAHATASSCCGATSCDTHGDTAELEAAAHDHHGGCPHHGDDHAAAELAEHQDADHQGVEHQDCEHKKPDSRHESCGAKCSFVSVNRVSVELDVAVVALGAFAAASVVTPENGFVVRRLDGWGASDAPPPLRLHLLHQLLLI
ncbi:MAG: hypothetical protein C0483_03785 [Pirellula sp.]|nr:hypothetical protein [Pirellula sp.]